jgi:excisionase family DNA binding protein
MSDDTMLVTLTVTQLREIVRDEVVLAIEEHRAGAQPEPDLVGAPEMARRLGVSRTTLHRLRTAGLPAIKVGDVYRYKPAAVLAYLEQQEKKSA